jgi:POT family proton-dependent oligopeptide transporter
MFGENVDRIANENGISYFFWMLTFIAVGLGVFSVIMQPVIKKLMHGIK